MKIKLLLISKFILLSILHLSIGQVNEAKAGDFDWLNNLSIEARADPSGFRVRLSTRFNIGSTQIRAVINQVDSASDAYMVLRLGELSSRPINDVLYTYRNNRSKGWGKMAKELGIKPGSQDFHSLKRGHDLGGDNCHGSKKAKGKKNKNRAKNKNKEKKNKH